MRALGSSGFPVGPMYFTPLTPSRSKNPRVLGPVQGALAGARQLRCPGPRLRPLGLLPVGDGQHMPLAGAPSRILEPGSPQIMLPEHAHQSTAHSKPGRACMREHDDDLMDPLLCALGALLRTDEKSGLGLPRAGEVASGSLGYLSAHRQLNQLVERVLDSWAPSESGGLLPRKRVSSSPTVAAAPISSGKRSAPSIVPSSSGVPATGCPRVDKKP